MHWGEYRINTPRSVATVVSALTGQSVEIVDSKDKNSYAVGRKSDGTFILKIPLTTTVIDDHARTAIVHECLHIMYTQFHLTEEAIDTALAGLTSTKERRDAVHDFLNAFEDVRINRKGMKRFLGCRPMFAESADQAIFNLEAHSRKLPAHYVFLSGLITLCEGFASFTKDIKPVYEEAVRAYNINGWIRGRKSATGANTYDNYFKDVGNRIENAANVVEVMEIACAEFLEPYLQLHNGKSLSQSEKEQITEALKSLAGKIDAGEGCKPEDKDGSGEGVREADGTTGDKIMEKAKRKAGILPGTDVGRSADESKVHKGRPIEAAIERALNPILSEIRVFQERGGWRGDELKGPRLDSRRLFRPSMEDGRVFKTRLHETKDDDVAWSIAIDVSGSMNEIIHAAAGCTSGLVSAITKNGRDCSIIAFDGKANVVKEYRTFTRDPLTDILKNFRGGGTCVREGYDMALDTVRGAQNRTKVVCVITDGDVSSSDLNKLEIPKGVYPYFIAISHYDDALSILRSKLKDGTYGSRVVRPDNVDDFVSVFKTFVMDVLNR
jgi:von Willebrand factor type A domain